MDTGNINNPYLPVELPDGVVEQLNNIPQEDFTLEDHIQTDYGLYNVAVTFDSRVFKSFAFINEITAMHQDRTKEPNVLANLLASVIKNIRVFRIYEEPYHKKGRRILAESSSQERVVNEAVHMDVDLPLTTRAEESDTVGQHYERMINNAIEASNEALRMEGDTVRARPITPEECNHGAGS